MRVVEHLSKVIAQRVCGISIFGDTQNLTYLYTFKVPFGAEGLVYVILKDSFPSQLFDDYMIL